MKKVVLSIGAAAIIVLAAINVNIALKSEGISKSIMANIVALADNENPGSGENGGGNGVEQCDIFLYARNHVEAWENVEVKASISVGGSFTWGGKTYSVNIAVSAGATVRVPICEESTGNCCKKSHMSNEVQYL